jgi:pyruvate kinase
MISRFQPAEWVVAISRDPAVSQGLQFSYGILPRSLGKEPEDWGTFIKECLKEHCPSPSLALLVAGPSASYPDAHHRVEFVTL